MQPSVAMRRGLLGAMGIHIVYSVITLGLVAATYFNEDIYLLAAFVPLIAVMRFATIVGFLLCSLGGWLMHKQGWKNQRIAGGVVVADALCVVGLAGVWVWFIS